MKREIIPIRNELMTMEYNYGIFPFKGVVESYKNLFDEWATAILEHRELPDDFFVYFIRDVLSNNVDFRTKQYLFYSIIASINRRAENGYERARRIVSIIYPDLIENRIKLLMLLRIFGGESAAASRLSEIIEDFKISFIYEIKRLYDLAYHRDIFSLISLAAIDNQFLASVSFVLQVLQKEIDAGSVYDVNFPLPQYTSSGFPRPWRIKILALEICAKFISRNKIPNNFFITIENSRFFEDSNNDLVDEYATNKAIRMFLAGYRSPNIITQENYRNYTPSFYRFFEKIISLNNIEDLIYTPFHIANAILPQAYKLYEFDIDTPKQINRPTKKVYRTRLIADFKNLNRNEDDIYIKAIFVLHNNCIDLLKNYPEDTRVFHDFDYPLTQQELEKILKFLFLSEIDLMHIGNHLFNKHYPFSTPHDSYVYKKLQFLLAKNNFVMNYEFLSPIVKKLIDSSRVNYCANIVNVIKKFSGNKEPKIVALQEVLFKIIKKEQVDAEFVVANFASDQEFVKLLDYRNHLKYSDEFDALKHLIKRFGGGGHAVPQTPLASLRLRAK
jgi:hypothetical protein